MNTEQERADFEAFASQHGLCVTEDGDLYRSHVVAWMWKAWQARAALQSQPDELAMEDIEYELRNMASSAYEVAMSFGVGLDSFERLANDVFSYARSALQSQDRGTVIEEGFRWRSTNPPYKIWNYVWDRAPDSWELREAEIQNVVVYARRVEGEQE